MNIKKIKKLVDEYFKTVSIKKLKKDLKTINYDYYKNIKIPVLNGKKKRV